jgi:hypothetical protein
MADTNNPEHLTDKPPLAVGDTTTTIAHIHPEYDPDDEIFLIAHPQPSITDPTNLLTYPVPRTRLELITPLSGGADR